MPTSPKPTDFGRTQRPNEQWLALAAPEPALEPDLPIIDTHMHLWRHATGYSYFVEDYARDIAASGHNVEASVYIECRSMYRASGPEYLKCIGETEFAAGMAAIALSEIYTKTKVGSGIVGYADLRDGEHLEEVLDAHLAAANGRFRGVRQRAKWDADPTVKGAVSADGPGVLLDPRMREGLAKVAERGLIFEASIFHPQIPDVLAMAEAAPRAEIVVIHSGSPVGHGAYRGKEQEVRADWLASMRSLARCPNVTIKLGGILMSLANFDFGQEPRPPTSAELAELWRPFIEPCFEIFGPDRCMVASNFPVDKAGFGFGTVWNMFKRLTAGCSADEKAAIFSGNARRVYRL